MRVIYLSFLLIFTITACTEKIEIKTEAQLTAEKLKADISSHEEDIKRIHVINFYDITSFFEGSSYVITSGGLIVITTTGPVSATFNLGELKSYALYNDLLILYY
jgi:hypothetical protein